MIEEQYAEEMAVPHLWAVEFPYEGVSQSCGVFATLADVEAYIEADKYLSGYAYPVPMVIR